MMVDKRRESDRKDPPSGARDDSLEALERYGQIMARDPASLVFAALAEAHRKQGQWEKAITVCRKGLRQHPDFVSGRVALARAYADAGRVDQARQELERVVHAAPDNIVAQKLLAELYLRDGELDQLEKTAHRILALDASDTQARDGLAWIRDQRGNGDVPELEPTEDEALPEILTRTLAEIYASQGHVQKAYDIYQKLSLREPANALFHERLAELKGKLIVRNGRQRS